MIRVDSSSASEVRALLDIFSKKLDQSGIRVDSLLIRQ